MCINFVFYISDNAMREINDQISQVSDICVIGIEV